MNIQWEAGKYTENFDFVHRYGESVLELVETFERVNGVPVPHVFAPRRPGDVAACYADAAKAARLLGWRAEKTLEDMCRDAWRWQQGCEGGN